MGRILVGDYNGSNCTDCGTNTPCRPIQQIYLIAISNTGTWHLVASSALSASSCFHSQDQDHHVVRPAWMHDMLRTPSEHRRGSYASFRWSTSLLNQVVRVGDALAFSTRTIWLLCFGHAALLTTERVDYPYSLLLLYLYIWYHFYVPQYSERVDQTIRRLLTNALSATWGKYSSVDEYHLQNMGQVFVPWANTLRNTWGKYSYYRRIPPPGIWGKYLPMDE